MRWKLQARFALFLCCLVALGCTDSGKKKGQLCQSDSQCDDGICVGGQCAALQACTATSECDEGICNEGYCWKGQCTDSTQCTLGTECLQGYCVRKTQSVDANDGGSEDANVEKDKSSENQCTRNSDCDGKLGQLGQCELAECVAGVCVKGNQSTATVCNDSNGCTTEDRCDGKGTCVGKTANPCVDANDPCKQEANSTCTSTGDTTYSCDYGKNINNQVSCNDSNGCTSSDMCNAEGKCVGQTNPCVDASDACKQLANTSCTSTGDTTYTCDYQKNVDNKVACNDKSGCTTSDLCSATGTCVGSVDPCVDANDPCKQEANSACTSTGDTTYTCLYQKNVDDKVSCNDKDGCTVGDSCDEKGACISGTSNPCVDSNDACKQLVNSDCTSTGDTTYSCDYQKNITNNVVCDDQNVCTYNDACTAMGTCGGLADFGRSCTIPDKKYTVCGFFGECEEIKRTVYKPTVNPLVHFSAICQPSPGVMRIIGGYETELGQYGSLVAESYLVSENDKISDRSTLDSWNRFVSEGRIGAFCAKDHLIVSEWDDGYILRKAFRWVGGAYAQMTKLYDALTSMKAGEDSANVSAIHAMIKLGADNLWISGLIGPNQDQHHLANCIGPKQPGDQYTCKPAKIGALYKPVSASNNYNIAALFGIEAGPFTEMWLLAASGQGPGSWRFVHYTSDGPTSTFAEPKGCDGSNSQSICWATRGWFDGRSQWYSGGTRLQGFRDIHGLDNTEVYVVGENEKPAHSPFSWPSSKPTSQPTTELRKGRMLRWQKDLTAWEKVEDIPNAMLVQEVSNVGWIDYVYQRVRMLDKDTILVQGYYRACIETNPLDCWSNGTGSSADRIVTIKVRNFMFVYRPNAPQARRWTKMTPLGDGTSIKCCPRSNGNSCTDNNYQACGSYNRMWIQPTRGMQIHIGADTGRVVWVGNNTIERLVSEPVVWQIFSEK